MTGKRLFAIKRYFCGQNGTYMKRLIVLVLGLILASGGLMAQQDTVNGKKKTLFKLNFSGTAAYSVPLGDYAENDKTGTSSGYAAGGFTFSLGLNWIGRKGFGLGASYVFQYNALQKTAKEVTPDGQNYQLGDKPWNNHYLLAGPVYYQSFGKLTVEAGILVGVVIAISPNFYISIPDSLSQSTTSQGAGTGFAYKLMAGVGYQVSKRVSFSANLSYLGGSPSRTKDYYYYYYVNDPLLGLIPVYQGAEVTIKKKISTFNPGIGITIKL